MDGETRLRVSGVVAEGDEITLDEAQRHHVCRVLRLGEGAVLEVVDGQGERWVGVLRTATEPAVEIQSSVTAESADPGAQLEVWLPLLKGGRTEDLVRQLTELGVIRIVPFISRRSVVQLRGDRVVRQLSRWRTIAEEATRQCGRADLPLVLEPQGLPEVGPGVVLWEEGGDPARQVLSEVAHDGFLRVLTGPEGGLEPGEIQSLETLGWRSAYLGPRILRADTAVIATATLALHALEEGGY
ncbi:MAG: RsmE family RNA methyltransferase [Myxococcota bacterium]|nr:RsmE family RNA methyltransferase [Myxococcota bacterium]